VFQVKSGNVGRGDIAEMVEQHKRLDIPMSLEVLKKAQSVALKDEQPELFTDEPEMPPLPF
jgi:hypothetical protein